MVRGNPVAVNLGPAGSRLTMLNALAQSYTLYHGKYDHTARANVARVAVKHL